MDRARRMRGSPIAREPLFPASYDPARQELRPNYGPEYDDEPNAAIYDQMAHSQPVEPQGSPSNHQPMSYRDHSRLPSAYRATLRDQQQYPSPTNMATSLAAYKILCITNINPKIGDNAVKETLTNDFSRFGDISVSICHDSGERLAYIYFRTYEEAREARHAKVRALLFDRPIEIEPIYEPRISPIDSSPPPIPQQPPTSHHHHQQQPHTQPAPLQPQTIAHPHHMYPRRRSVTPPDYYGFDEHMNQRLRMHHPHAMPYDPRGGISSPPPPPPPGLPPTSYHSSREHLHEPGSGPMPPHLGQITYSGIDARYYHQPPPSSHHLDTPLSPYSSPPPEHYRSYYPQPAPTHLAPQPPPPSQHHHPHQHPGPLPPPPAPHSHHPNPHIAHGHSQHHRHHPRPAGPPSHHMSSSQEHERMHISEPHHYPYPPRSPHFDAYYPIEHRAYPQIAQHQSRSSQSSSHYSSLRKHHPINPQNMQPPAAPTSHVSQSSPSSSSAHSAPQVPSKSNQLSEPSSAPVRFMSREYRREKFGRANYSKEPEENRPSRVIFVTNIDNSKTEDDLKDIFQPFGIIEELEIRKVNADVSSALIKFSSMDCAYKARTAINGRYIGTIKCRILYGKVSASRRLWVGGFGPATTNSCIENDFGRFGNIVNLDYSPGRPYAYVEFETDNQAQFATLHLKGTLSSKAEKRLRMEYVDPVERIDKSVHGSQASDGSVRSRIDETWTPTNEQEVNQRLNRKRSLTPTIDEMSTKRAYQTSNSTKRYDYDDDESDSRLLPRTSSSSLGRNDVKTASNESNQEPNNNQNCLDQGDEITKRTTISTFQNDLEASDESSSINAVDVNNGSIESKSIKEVVAGCPVSWFCQIVLRNFIFPSRIYMCRGNEAAIVKYLGKLNGESSGKQHQVLKITQRWRLYPLPKLQEIKKRMQSANSGVFIIVSNQDQNSKCITNPATVNKVDQNGDNEDKINQQHQEEEQKHTQAPQSPSSNQGAMSSDKIDAEESGESSLVQIRPLRNLINYLEQKRVVAAIPLSAIIEDDEKSTTDATSDNSPKLLAFPPGDLALNFLKKLVPELASNARKEEFLLGVIVGGAVES